MVCDLMWGFLVLVVFAWSGFSLISLKFLYLGRFFVFILYFSLISLLAGFVGELVEVCDDGRADSATAETHRRSLITLD